MNTLVLALCMFAAVASAADHPFTVCKNTNLLGVDTIVIAPDPVQAGDSASVTISGIPEVDVGGGLITTVAKLGPIKIATQVRRGGGAGAQPLVIGQPSPP